MQYVCSKMFTDLNIKFQNNCIKNCCKSILGEVNIQDLEEPNYFINNKDYLDRKEKMLFKNQLPENYCDTCIKTEPNSLFRSWNTFGILSEEQKKILYKKDSFTTYELVLSSACDLKCVYCHPKDSSSWAKELGVPVVQGDSVWEENVTNKLLDHLKNKIYDEEEYHFFFSGGEPTYNPKTILMIEKILAIVPENKIKIIISTNSNTKSKVFAKYKDLIAKKPNVKWIFDCSIDDLKERCEAIRYGINWKIAINNIKELLTYNNVTVRISPTINLYSLTTMSEFVDFFIQLFESYNKLDTLMFNFNMVQESDLSPMSMPIEYKKYLDYSIQKCKEKNIIFYKHLVNVQNLIGTKINENTASKIENKFNYFKTKRPEVNWDELFPHVNVVIKELRNNEQ